MVSFGNTILTLHRKSIKCIKSKRAINDLHYHFKSILG